MSDSGLNSVGDSPVDRPDGEPSRSSGMLRAMLLVNGVACCGLILALAWFGRRGDSSSATEKSGESKPFAKATDSVVDDDDDGRPKIFKIELKWPADGVVDFELIERSGKSVRKSDLLGHPWVVSFIFTNCAGPCFRVTSAFRKLQEEFLNDDTDLRLVTITVDPERDQPDVLTKYANGFMADQDRWLFLTDPTGAKDKIYRLINGSFLMPVMEAQGKARAPGFEFIHTNNVLLVDEKGVVQGKWLSTDEAEFDSLRRELKKRLKKSN